MENGALDVDKDSCYLIPLSQTITNRTCQTALEKTMLIHATYCLINPANYPCFNLKKVMKDFFLWCLHSVA